MVPGRAFLRRIIDLTRGKHSPSHHIRLTKEARADLSAWYQFLLHFNGKNLFLDDTWLSSDKIRLYTDAASTLGYAAVFGTKWFNGSWPTNWDNYHITIKELFPIVAAVEVWGHMLRNHCILCMSDNEAVVHVINKQSSQEPTVMILIRRLVICAMRFNIMFKAKQLPGKYNVVADKLSRFQLQEAWKTAPWLDKEPETLPVTILPWTC